MNFPSSMTKNIRPILILLLIAACTTAAFSTTDIIIRYGICSITFIFVCLHRFLIPSIRGVIGVLSSRHYKHCLIPILPYLYILHLDHLVSFSDEDWNRFNYNPDLGVFTTIFSAAFGVLSISAAIVMLIQFIDYSLHA